MDEQPRFCTTCGANLVADARFCTKCGKTVADPSQQAGAPATPPAPAPDPGQPTGPPPPMDPAAAASRGETVMATIPNAMLKAGFMGVGSKPYILVLTDRRVIFARITSEMMKQLVSDARDDAKSQGKGFMGQWGAQLTAYAKFAERYSRMHPDEILAETPENFAIDRSTIRKAKLKAGTMNEDGATSSDRLIIKTTDKTYTIVLNNGIGPAKTALIAARMI